MGQTIQEIIKILRHLFPYVNSWNKVNGDVFFDACLYKEGK